MHDHQPGQLGSVISFIYDKSKPAVCARRDAGVEEEGEGSLKTDTSIQSMTVLPSDPRIRGPLSPLR